MTPSADHPASKGNRLTCGVERVERPGIESGRLQEQAGAGARRRASPNCHFSSSRGGDQHVSFDAWFDDVQVSESKVVQLLCYVVKQRDRITVRYPVPSSARRDAHSDTVAAPHRNHCFNHLKQEAGSVLDRTTVHIGPLIDAILQKLIGQVAVTRVKLNAVKIRGFCVLGGFAIILDNARDFFDFKRAVMFCCMMKELTVGRLPVQV